MSEEYFYQAFEVKNDKKEVTAYGVYISRNGFIVGAVENKETPEKAMQSAKELARSLK